MDKYQTEIQETRDAVKKKFMAYFEKKSNGRGYYNWTDSDDTIIEFAIRETWSKHTS